jgi:hypothetical protein
MLSVFGDKCLSVLWVLRKWIDESCGKEGMEFVEKRWG